MSTREKEKWSLELSSERNEAVKDIAESCHHIVGFPALLFLLASGKFQDDCREALDSSTHLIMKCYCITWARSDLVSYITWKLSLQRDLNISHSCRNLSSKAITMWTSRYVKGLWGGWAIKETSRWCVWNWGDLGCCSLLLHHSLRYLCCISYVSQDKIWKLLFWWPFMPLKP